MVAVAAADIPVTPPIKKNPSTKIVAVPTPIKPSYAMGLTQAEEKEIARKAILKQEEENRASKQLRKEVAVQEEAEAGTLYSTHFFILLSAYFW